MADLATLETRVEDLVKKNEALASENKSFKSQIDKLAETPNHAGIHAAPGVTSSFDDNDVESATLVYDFTSSYRGNMATQTGGQTRSDRHTAMKSIWKTLKSSGYQRCGATGSGFKSFKDFVLQGLEDNGRTQGFRDNYKKHMDPVFKTIQGMSESIGTDGGFGVIPEFNLKIHEHVYANNLFARTDGYTVSGNNMTFLANAETSRKTGFRAGGLQAYWTGEGSSITPSKPTIREIQMKLQKLAVVVYLTDELLKDNAIALEQYVTRKVSDEFAWMMGNSLFNGTGAGQPLGIINCPSLLVIAAVGGQSTLTIVSGNIITMQNRLFAPYMENASWFVNQDTIQQLMQLTLATGTYSGQLVYMPPTGLAGLPYGTLGGRPVEPIEFAASLTTQGDITLADLGQIISITKGGIQQAVSMHVEFLTDQMALRFTMRLNAQPWENSPITPANGTNTQSSFIQLASR
jgi:HK97 family phage major capsid protein